jgi:type IX secretion system PorP/SprF family membrane protein
MKQRTLLVIFVLSASRLLAQDQANFTQFYLNPYILNSSYAGIDGKASASLIYRRQWMNIDGGPSIANLSLHTPINPRVSTGLNINTDKRGLINNTTLLVSFGYNIQVKDYSFVRFGISAGGSWNTVDWAKLGDFSDTKLENLTDNHASLAGNAGVSYHSKTFHMGVSIPGIFSPSVASEDGLNISKVKPFQSLIIHGSNRFYFANNKHVFEPYAVYRLNSDLPSQFEVAGVLHLNHVIWLGGSFKEEFGISALGGIKLKNTLAIGGSYSLANSGDNELNSPTFEISLNMLLGDHKKNAPVYSFVDTHKPKEKKKPVHPPNSAQAALAKKKAEEEAAKKKLTAQQLAQKKTEEERIKKEQAEALARHQEEVKKRVEERKHEVVKAPDPVKVDSAGSHNPRFRQEMNVSNQIMEGHQEHEKEQISRLTEHKEDPTEHHNEEGHPHAERHEFVKRGSHAKELEVSDYVVGGVFRSEPNAKHFSEGLDKLGFDTHYGHLTEKNLWYVYVFKTTDINQAITERDRVRKMKILRDAWLLTVHH